MLRTGELGGGLAGGLDVSDVHARHFGGFFSWVLDGGWLAKGLLRCRDVCSKVGGKMDRSFAWGWETMGWVLELYAITTYLRVSGNGLSCIC